MKHKDALLIDPLDPANSDLMAQVYQAYFSPQSQAHRYYLPAFKVMDLKQNGTKVKFILTSGLRYFKKSPHPKAEIQAHLLVSRRDLGKGCYGFVQSLRGSLRIKAQSVEPRRKFPEKQRAVKFFELNGQQDEAHAIRDLRTEVVIGRVTPQMDTKYDPCVYPGAGLILMHEQEGISLEHFITEMNAGKIRVSSTERLKIASKLLETLFLQVQDLRLIYEGRDWGRLVHCDIKPANIIIKRQPLTLNFIDYGLAITERMRPSDLFPGTPLYMDPRAWRDRLRKPDRSTDLYSIALVIAELFCDKSRPNSLTDFKELKRLLMNYPFTNLFQGLDDLTETEKKSIKNILTNMLSPDLKDRPTRMGAIYYFQRILRGRLNKEKTEMDKLIAKANSKEFYQLSEETLCLCIDTAGLETILEPDKAERLAHLKKKMAAGLYRLKASDLQQLGKEGLAGLTENSSLNQALDLGYLDLEKTSVLIKMGIKLDQQVFSNWLMNTKKIEEDPLSWIQMSKLIYEQLSPEEQSSFITPTEGISDFAKLYDCHFLRGEYRGIEAELIPELINRHLKVCKDLKSDLYSICAAHPAHATIIQPLVERIQTEINLGPYLIISDEDEDNYYDAVNQLKDLIAQMIHVQSLALNMQPPGLPEALIKGRQQTLSRFYLDEKTKLINGVYKLAELGQTIDLLYKKILKIRWLDNVSNILLSFGISASFSMCLTDAYTQVINQGEIPRLLIDYKKYEQLHLKIITTRFLSTEDERGIKNQAGDLIKQLKPENLTESYQKLCALAEKSRILFIQQTTSEGLSLRS